ncbi:MAG: response regulator transcription factor [Defluviitaleaceae bacterium]|nr:response regulator transcription factor [Defluviitaleaceae bacterium]
MSNLKILVVDDDKHIAKLISLYMHKEGFETMEVYNGREAVDVFPAYAPFLVLLDLMLPGLNGYDVCKEIRKISSVPIIMLTAKGETFDKVRGLELGADDYIVKPFDPRELTARVKAVLRRYESNNAGNSVVAIDFPNLHIDPARHIVIYHGQELELPPKEYELLLILAQNPGQPMTRDDLLTACWGYDYPGDTRTVDVHIMRIREKLNKDDSWGIKTVWGIGYKLEVPK